MPSLRKFWVSRGGRRAVWMNFATFFLALFHGKRFIAPLPARIDRLVFVCAGNICRSPFGELAAKRSQIPSISLGLNASLGAPANAAAAACAQTFDVDMSGHQATPLSVEYFLPSDLVLCFEFSQALAIERRLGHQAVEIRLLGMLDGFGSWHIHDPYGRSDEYFLRCFSRIHRAVANFKAIRPSCGQ